MAYSSKTPINDIPLQTFIEQLSVLRAEDWQKRVTALRTLVNSIPDYSTTLLNEHGELLLTNNGLTNDNGGEVMWYRSPKMVRRLATPLKSLLLDARSAVVKEVTELIGILLRVKLQSHPSITMAETSSKNGTENGGGGLQTINGGSSKSTTVSPPPPFIGRLLFKDLLPSILDLSKQTVKVIRNYSVNMTLSILPYIRIKSTINLLIEKMKLNPSRTVREDCAKYLSCILSSWPWESTGSYDNISSNYLPPSGIVIVKNSRKDERLSLDSTRQIGLALGRTLSDPSKPVRDEVKKGFEVLYKRFRPIWDEVMSSGVVRDVRLRKKLLEVASRDVATSTAGGEGKGEGGSSTHLFDDMASLGEMSLNSAVSGLSYASHRSNVSHRSYASNRGERRIPSVIGTPVKVRSRRSPSNGGSSPSYMRNTGSSASRVSEQVGKIQAKESSYRYATNEYVTSSGHKLSTPSPKRGGLKPSSLYYRGEDGRDEGEGATEQPFASLMHTPTRPTRTHHMTPESQQKTCKVLRKRLSCRISGINGSVAAFEKELPDHIQSPSGLQSINELSLAPSAPPTRSPVVDEDTTQPEAEITTVALEVISAHLSHIDQMQSLVTKESELLSDLSTKLGVSITNEMNAAELSEHIAKSLSEEQVCDYYESVHVCVDKQRTVSEELLGEMERISTGDTSTIVSGIDSPASLHKDLPQSPKLDEQQQQSLQINLKDEF